ncbi:transcriptional regulator GlxA family with amidase domain [Amycolatopsis sulphurea]|uniref:Transcriptional regulator GlxA family with amidase domain n=1 Tax=Amycolatopsis sulphurea TaxID=76022 RepID=A0A2A9G2H6_9PSEU|nr:helix-turn-helix domain-containing protein [Amycolatopsis sulphurea]PFG57062.1 transcriptional regulator GlxA family with amidase domain [Amycolatopsis sulphurea]
MPGAPRQVVLIGYADAELLDIACVADVLDAANRLGAGRPYRVRLATVDGQPFPCQSGLTLTPHARLDQIRGELDTLVVAGGTGHRAAAADQRLLEHVRRLSQRSRRTASVCTGSGVLAAAGLLSGRRATTHWAHATELAARYPAVSVDPVPLFVRHGDTYTSAGVTSGLDLTLAFVEEDNGPALAREAARTLVTYLQRPGNQAQVSMFLSGPPPEHRQVRDLTAYVAEHLAGDLGTPVLARQAGISARQLTRLFDAHLGTTPGKYVRTVRAEHAARLLSGTDLPLTAIARRCGFGSTETLRQAFLDHFDTPPSAYRRVHVRTAYV